MDNAILIKIAEFQKSFSGVAKARANDFFKSKYANLDDVMDAATPVLEQAGLFVIQPIVVREGVQILQSTVFDIEGNSITSEMNLDAMCPKQDAQRIGSAITYARRYSFCSLLNIVTHDDDGNAAAKVPESKASKEQVMEIEGLIQTTGTDREKVVAHIKKSGWGSNLNVISFKQASSIIGMLKGK